MNKIEQKDARTGLEIAVIGMAGRFPGAGDINAFWENIKNGVESVIFFTDDELLAAGIDPGTLKNPNYVKAKGYLAGIEYFDAAFFNYTPREAEIMDPQVRLFHQCAYHALEDAGYDAQSYEGLIGLYAGYAPNILWKAANMLQKKSDAELLEVGNLNSNHFTANICYKLNLKGPAVSINTTCSTSLVAIHLAARALLTGEADIALAGGVSITLPGKTGYMYQEGMLMSRDGRCRPFDARANGMTPGDGAGVVVLKRLVKALKDRDHIYAVIKGSAVNNDGRRKPGFTAPSVQAQADVVRAALRAAGVEASSIGYVEAHGTGTPIGDPIEIEALKKAFIDPKETHPYKKHSCAVGSVKANIGHLDAAAGAAGFIKTVLAIYHRLIPPAVNFESPNPEADFENSPFYVNKEAQPWLPNRPGQGKTGSGVLRAGVSAYGIGGTNAHIVLEAWETAAPEAEPDARHDPAAQDNREYRLLLLSAKSRSALAEMSANLAEYLKKNPAIDLADAAYTLQVGRAAYNHRRMLLCRDIDETIQALLSGDPDQTARLREQQGKPGTADELEKIGKSWLSGTDIDWPGFYANEKRRRIPLPLYPFQEQHYNVDLQLDMSALGEQRQGAVKVQKQAASPAEVVNNRPETKTPYVPPRNKAEEILVEIWQDLLGIRPIGIYDNLMEMGVDSLKAIMFVNRFKEQLGEVIHVTGVFEAPTVQEFAVYFSEHYPESAALSGKAVPSTIELPKNFVMLHRPQTNIGNIFFVHEVCGDVGAYLEFCKQANTRFNCWGIEAERLKNFTPQNVTIEEISARYIRQIKQIQPHGPYYLATWSFGGNWGLEMALQLEQMGEKLAFLAFFDCSGPNGRIDKGSFQEYNLASEKEYLKQFFSDTGNEAALKEINDIEQLWLFATAFLKTDERLVAGLRQLLIENEQAIPNYHSLSGEELVQFLNIIRTFKGSGARYLPAGKIHTPIHYFLAEQNTKRQEYWNEYCHNPVIYHKIRGDHHSIFRDKGQIAEFAHKFNEVLENWISSSI